MDISTSIRVNFMQNQWIIYKVKKYYLLRNSVSFFSEHQCMFGDCLRTISHLYTLHMPTSLDPFPRIARNMSIDCRLLLSMHIYYMFQGYVIHHVADPMG